VRYQQPEQVLDDAATHEAVITTTHGDIRIRLHSQESPQAANSFAFLAGQGYFDGTIIHRVVPGFVIQMGDPTGTGTGDPGYRFPDELGSARERGYRRGTVAMANSGPNTNGSQFFICLDDVGLPPSYTVFGEVLEGMDVVDAIAGVRLRGERPADDVSITSVRMA
jgi:cyclophilin family peptidyl-prolyl cis-trans isomerase